MSVVIEGISHLNTDQLKRIMQQPDSNIVVLDVRELDEYIQGHIPYVPLIPMGNIPEWIEQFDKATEYVFVCRSGRRSLNVAHYFHNAGISNVHNYLGGVLDWEVKDNKMAFGEEHVIEQFSMEALKRRGTL